MALQRSLQASAALAGSDRRHVATVALDNRGSSVSPTVFRRGRRGRRAIVRGATAVVLSVVVVGAAQRDAPAQTSPLVAEVESVSPQIGARLRPYSPLLQPLTAAARPVPAHPVEALIEATRDLTAKLNFRQDPGPAIRAAAIPPDVAGRLAVLLRDMYACHVITTKYRDLLSIQLPALFRDRRGLQSTDYPDVLPCAIRMWVSAGELEVTIKAALGPAEAGGCRPMRAGSVDIWPVLRFEPGCAGQTYRNDYLLTVDVGGDDTYANNVGSNVVDINYSPPGAAVKGLRGTGPAKGCQHGLNGLGRNECYLSASVLLDLQGADSFGVLESPDVDQLCTRDPVVRRMLTGGAAFLGVGILRDAGHSNDRYYGKTVSLGSAHMFGVGILSDAGGDDTYLAVRNSEGYALLGGLGLLHDEGGNDVYDYYMPAPLDPAAPNQADGAGGVRDNEGDGYCDHVPRYTLGGANLLSSATGMLVDDSGDDRYHAAFSDLYTTNPAIPGMLVTGGSLGYGGNDALGVFLDRGGHDTYRVDNLPVGLPQRADKVVIRPGTAATNAWGVGLFIDR
jgi:hypothetical protein